MNHKNNQMSIGAAIGLGFTINSFIATHLFADSGFIAAVCALIAIAATLAPILTTVFNDLKEGKMRMHELAVLAVFASISQGDLKTSALISMFILLSLIIETRTASGAHASLDALTQLTPGKATRLNPDGSEETIASQFIKVGDIIRVRPGESIYADGMIVKGNSSINEANITGESLPVDKGKADPVFAGTSNLSGIVDIEVLKAGNDTTIGKVKELILKAQASKLPFVKMIDRYAGYYIPLALMLAATVLFFTQHQPDSIDRVIAILVTACPIALILATPAAVMAALSAAARCGVLFKDVNDIEAMAHTDTFIFDKTGTLTTGILEVKRLAPLPGIETSELLKTAAQAEFGSRHPVANAICELARKVNLPFTAPDRIHEEPGRGVKAVIDQDEIIAGNLPWALQNGARKEDFPELDAALAEGMSMIFVLRNGTPLGWIGLGDHPRDEARETLAELERLGIRHIAMVSGDRNAVVNTVAATLNIAHTAGECSPADKVDYITKMKTTGAQVVFVGDGVNDAPALAASRIGIAMGAAGSDIAINSATIALMNNDLQRLPFLLKLARGLRATIMQNFTIGAIIIGGGFTFSALGKLSPVLAAVLQACGAAIVALNSARLIRMGEELQSEPVPTAIPISQTTMVEA